MNNAQDRVVAQVGGKPIMESEIDAMLMQMGQRGQSYNNPQGRAMILDQIINKKLFLLDAQRNLIERDPAFKEQLARVKEELLASYNIQKAVEKVRVTDEEVKKYYDEHPEQFDSGESFNASHILVDNKELAAELKAKIESGELTFENAAMEHSTCPSGKQGGSLGDFGHGQMVPEFENACSDMNEGELSDPVQTQFGWHLIKLNKKSAGGLIEFSLVKNEIMEALMGEKQQAAYQSKVNQLKILYPVDKMV